MNRHIETPTPEPTGNTALPGRVRSILRLFGRTTGRRRPVSTETDAKLRASQVRSATFRPGLY